MISAQHGTESIFVKADVGKAEESEALVAATMERFGALHVACNNAGIVGEYKDITETSLEGWKGDRPSNSMAFSTTEYQSLACCIPVAVP